MISFDPGKRMAEVVAEQAGLGGRFPEFGRKKFSPLAVEVNLPILRSNRQVVRRYFSYFQLAGILEAVNSEEHAM